MAINWENVTDKIFNMLKGMKFSVVMFDENMKKTFDIANSRQFYATNPAPFDPNISDYKILISLIDDNQYSHCDLQTPYLRNAKDFDTIMVLHKWMKKNVNDIEGITLNWYQFDKEIEPKDPVQESADVSKPWGTTRSSFQQIGNCRLIVRHSDVINEEIPGSRWRKIHKVFIETSQGERFSYPHCHVKGARALARHMNNGGNNNDAVSNHIRTLSEDLYNLKKTARKLRSVGQQDNRFINPILEIHEAIKSINRELNTWCGPRGYNRMMEEKPFDKKRSTHSLPIWLMEKSQELFSECIPVMEKYLLCDVEPQQLNDLEEFQEWLLDKSDDDQNLPNSSREQACDLAVETWTDYQLDSGDTDLTSKQVMQYLVGANDWWRAQWETDPQQAQNLLMSLTKDYSHRDSIDESITRLLSLAGMRK